MFSRLTHGAAQVRLPPEVNRVVFCRNLPYKISAEEMYDIFGKYGPIRQIRVYVAKPLSPFSACSCPP